MRPSPARAIAIATTLAGICAYLNMYATQAILPSLASAFDVPLARTTLTVTLPLLAVALLAPFVGAISDRLGRKRLIVGRLGPWCSRRCFAPPPKASTPCSCGAPSRGPCCRSSSR